jgi:hypothetical protein
MLGDSISERRCCWSSGLSPNYGQICESGRRHQGRELNLLQLLPFIVLEAAQFLEWLRR